ncbi:MAG: FkbM family methyltransferase [Gemmatimonas sp.]
MGPSPHPVPSRRLALGLIDRARLTLGIARSLKTYYGDRDRRSAMSRLYARFLQRGDLAFDVGAHVGDRTACFLALGCRVVAVEPQPALARLLRWRYGRHVAVVHAAVGSATGELALNVNLDNPTVATCSGGFVAAARRSPRWMDERWTRRITVPLTTLDGLIAIYGEPAFIKIDVEGFEAEVLAGLGVAVRALSFEFTTLQRDVARRALDRCVALGRYRFNAAIGESQRFVFDAWCPADDIARWIAGLPDDVNSGDVYAALAPPDTTANAPPLN